MGTSINELPTPSPNKKHVNFDGIFLNFVKILDIIHPPTPLPFFRMITKTINAIVRQIRWYLKIADWAFYLGEKCIGFFFGVNQEPGAVHPATEVQGRLPPKI